MRCPHCNTSVNVRFENSYVQAPSGLGESEDIGYGVGIGFCPECNKPIAQFYEGTSFYSNLGEIYLDPISYSEVIYPKFSKNREIDVSIPDQYKNEFFEAENVLSISPKASATLSRRLLQLILENELNIKKCNLADEIATLSEKGNVPSELIQMLTVLRKVANFGAHPKKSINTGEIIEIEDGEAEILLEILYELFDFVFVKPKRLKEFQEQIKKKYNIEGNLI
jgi:hypothetical protein